jgi:hypothetical protein
VVEFGDTVDIDDGTTVDSEVEGRKKVSLTHRIGSGWQRLTGGGFGQQELSKGF